MKVAVCLTGLCSIDPSNISKVFKVFEYLTDTKGIQFDYYMQFWNSSNYYFYELSDNILQSKEIVKIPTVRNEIYSQIISHIKPKEILGLNFTDVVLKSGLNKNKNYTRSENTQMAFPYDGPNFIDSDIFTEFKDMAEWCWYHNSYVDFVNQRAQFFSLQEIVKTVPKNQYDLILKWRYDILTDYTFVLTNTNAFPNTMYVPGIFRKKINKPIEEIKSLIVKNEEYTYAIFDMWFYGKENEFRKLANNLLSYSIENFDESTRKFREKDESAATMDESAFLDKMLDERLIVKPVGACDTRIIHPLYKVSEKYNSDPLAELKRMQVDDENRYNLLKKNSTYAKGELGSETVVAVRGEKAFTLK